MTEGSDRSGQRTVLIVENQTLMREALLDFLRPRFPECDFLGATDGAGARQACDVHRPVLVLMDKHLPDTDGIELTSRLKELNPAIEVIVMSYNSEAVYMQHALAAGARAMLNKDNLASELIPAVAAALGIPAAAHGEMP